MKTTMKPPCVLIVDDVIDNIVLLDGLLKDQYQIKAANSGAKALKIAAVEPRPDLIILDIMMPEMDGFEVIRHLKADPALAEIPVIFLTAKSSVEDETTGLELGAVDFIAKPINPPIVLARVRTQLLVKQAYALLRQKNALMESNLRAAGEIQGALLPHKIPDMSHVKCSWIFQPCEAVGGDLLNVIKLDQTHIGAYVLDVVGHGLPAAMITFAISQAMQPYSDILVTQESGQPAVVRPGKVLRRLAELFPYDRFNGYFTMAYLVIDLAHGRVVSSSGGHPAPLILRTDGTLLSLDQGGPLIGMGEPTFDEEEHVLASGDKIFLYSDGLTEIQNQKAEFFGLERLEEILTSAAGEDVETVCDRVKASLRNFAGAKTPPDDITLLGLKYY